MNKSHPTDTILVEIEQCHLTALRDFARALREQAIAPEHWGSEENLDATLDAVAEALDEPVERP